MPIKTLAATLSALFLATTAGQAAESTLQLQLSTTGDFDQRTVVYDCGSETPLTVTYLNAQPNFLALLTPPEETDAVVFAAVLSDDGARYAAGHWLWSTQGQEASLHDAALGEDAEPVVRCSEIVNTP